MSNDDLDRRTLPPTEQRIREFRKRGEVGVSKELTGAVTSMAGAIALLLVVEPSIRATGGLFVGVYSELNPAIMGSAIKASENAFITACWPMMLAAILAWCLFSAVQLGWPPALVKPKFDITKPFKLSGLGQLVSPKQAAWRTTKAILRLILVGSAAAIALDIQLAEFFLRPALTADVLLDRFQNASLGLFTMSGGALVALGVADWTISKNRIMAKMRMTPEELKRELKNQEGDPEIKRQRRRRMRELAQRKLATAVPTADVIVVNPTHYSVALRYDPELDGAPRVVAKGKDILAAKIREIARENNIPILEKPPLARLLYRTVPEGKLIPADLYRAVAEVLAYVYKIRKGAGRKRRPQGDNR